MAGCTHLRKPVAALAALCILAASGCRSPYYADRGAFAGTLAGAGIGALVGNAVGNTGAGTAIGAGVGALTGGAVGGALDDIQARNRAEIAAQLGRPVAHGAATVEEIVAMSQAGVNPQLIVNYVSNSGVARPINAQEVIFLHQQGVANEVIDAMQRLPAPPEAIHVAQPPSPVIIEAHHFGSPHYCPPRRQIYYRHRHHSPRVGFGFSISG